jgi:uncharacterized repeat protein (TIGR01451 family)
MKNRGTLLFLVLFALVFCAAGCAEDRARVMFFLDMNSKAPQPGTTVQYIFVIRNEGWAAAENVVLPDPLVQMQPYEHLSHVTYVPGSMSINREYHPDTSRESYYFVERIPLTDASDSDEGTYDEAANTLFFRMARMEPDDYVLWAFEVKVDDDAPCATFPYMQNIVTISADNSDSYENDIIGHIVCQSPKLRVEKTADVTEAAPGAQITYTLSYSLDLVTVSEIDSSRFDIRRVRIFDRFPTDTLEIVSIGDGGEERDDAVFWQIDPLANGGSGSVTWKARVSSAAPAGAQIVNNAEILSQNTVEEQDVGGSFTVTVTAP